MTRCQSLRGGTKQVSRGPGGRRGERARCGLGGSKRGVRRRVAHCTRCAQELGFSSVSISEPLKAACRSWQKLSYLSAHLQKICVSQFHLLGRTIASCCGCSDAVLEACAFLSLLFIWGSLFCSAVLDCLPALSTHSRFICFAAFENSGSQFCQC